MQSHYFYPHVSVDCVLFGFDGDTLKVLLVERNMAEGKERYNDMKLPGRLIYEDEDLDHAANDVLFELIGTNVAYLRQFKCFGSPARTSNPEDVLWLENAVKLKIGRIVTVAYMSLVRIDRRLNDISSEYKALWYPVSDIKRLAFDHHDIVLEALKEIQRNIKVEPSLLFELLPGKFTAHNLRTLYEVIYNRKMDVRNFHKKIASMNYVVALEEKQTNVSHRAARYYRFDKKIYNKRYGQS